MIEFTQLPAGYITAAGFYRCPASRYHPDPCFKPSLSSSIAVTLLDETPAHAKAAHPRLTTLPVEDSNAAMNKGSVVHELVLGEGGGFDVLAFDTFQSGAAKKARDESRLAGRVPVLQHAYDDCLETADAIKDRLHWIKDVALALDIGHKEVVYIWRDIGGPWCRSMDDLLVVGDDKVTCLDIKTTGRGLSDRTIQSKIADGLDLKAAYRVRGLTQLLPHLAGRIEFKWIFAEIEAPFEVRVWDATREMLDIGDRKAAYAIELWRRCVETNLWPGYPRKVERMPMPNWYEAQWMAREVADSDQDIILASHPLARHQPVARPNVLGKNILGAG